MSISLIVVDFTAHLLGLVRDFACGEADHERELADWIRNESVQALQRDCKVWLYVTEQEEVVGFGSLALTRWHYPDPSSKRVQIALIPAVAIQQTYWGKPDGPKKGRYSSQILDHLIVEAAKLPSDVQVLGLFVHPDNQRAVKVYERAGFHPFPQTYTDKATDVTYQSMIRLITKIPAT